MAKLTRNTRILVGASAICMLAMQISANAGEIVVMGYSDSAFQDNFLREVVNPFMEEHPEIKVNYFPVLNAATALGQLRAQKAAPQADLVVFDLSIANLAKQEDLIGDFDVGQMKNVGDLGKIGRQLGDSGLPFTYDTIGLAYATDAVSTPPESWNVMWDPAYKGKVVVSARSDVQATAFSVIVDKMMGGTDYLNNLDKGYERLIELAPNVQTWEPKPDQYTLLANGSAALSTGWNARNQQYALRTGGKVGAVTPADGTVAAINVLSPIKGSANQADAVVFADYAISSEVQKRWSAATFYSPTNVKVELPAELQARIPLLDPKLAEGVIDVDWIALSDKREGILATWKRRIIPASR